MLSPQQNYVMFLLVTLTLQYVHTTSISLIEFSTPIKHVLAFLIVLYAYLATSAVYMYHLLLNFNFCSMAQSIDSTTVQKYTFFKRLEYCSSHI